MKPKNNTEVRKAYLRFSGYLTSCIVLAVTIFACFLKTSGTEVKRITEQTLEYDLSMSGNSPWQTAWIPCTNT